MGVGVIVAVVVGGGLGVTVGVRVAVAVGVGVGVGVAEAVGVSVGHVTVTAGSGLETALGASFAACGVARQPDSTSDATAAEVRTVMQRVGTPPAISPSRMPVYSFLRRS